MPSSQVIDPTQLNLSADELSLLRQGQYAVAHGGGGSSSSRAASRASSQGMFLLDQNSLAALDVHFERVMRHIEQQLIYLSEQTAMATQIINDQSGQMIAEAEIQIERFKMMDAQIDELELDFDRIHHIREIVRENKRRLEEMDREFDRLQGHSSSHHSSSRRREGHRESHSSRHHRR